MIILFIYSCSLSLVCWAETSALSMLGQDSPIERCTRLHICLFTCVCVPVWEQEGGADAEITTGCLPVYAL